ncbi:MAG: DHA2 family efflux MFS transporter permease subunit [Chlamydiia bacterium]
MSEPKDTLTTFQLLVVTFAILMASLLFVLDYSISSVILPYVVGDLGARVEQGTYIVTTFSVGNAFAIPLMFFLLNYFGKKRLFVLSLLIFPFTSVVCGLTDSFEVLLFFRFLLGVISGPILPLALFILMDLYPEKYHQKVFGIWASTMISAPMLGPIIGGFFATVFTWRIAFLIMIPIGLLCGLTLWIILSMEKERKIVPFDTFGFILLGTMSICIQFIMDKGQQWDWYRSPLVLFLTAIFLLALALFIVWSRYSEAPILNFSLLKRKTFSLSIILVLLTYSSFFATVVIIPIWLETYMGYDAFKSGLANAPVGVLPFLIAPFLGYFFSWFSSKKLLFFSMVVFAAISYWTTNFYIDIDLYHIQLSRLILGLGFAFYLAPLMTLSLEEINESERSSALIFFHFCRVTAGALGTSCFTTIWTRRGYFHRQFLTEFVTPLNPYTGQFLEAAKKVPFGVTSPPAELNSSLQNQAVILALLDVFWAIMWCYIIAASSILLWWLWDRIERWSKGGQDPINLAPSKPF